MQRSNPDLPGAGSGSGPGGSGSPEPGNLGSSYSEEIATEICVIGAGSGGLYMAAAAAKLGVPVVLIEKHKMGGDCLNYGCVPSKALIAAARRAHLMRTSAPFGIAPVAPAIDHRAVHDHVKGVIAAIAPNDSVERFTGLGVRVVHAAARFRDKSSVIAGDTLVKARRFVIAAGSSPAVPPIPGLENVPYFTNETLFDNQQRIDHLIVVGGGPIGIEMAQAHLRLGSRVTVLEGMKALAKDDPELAEVVLKSLREEGVVIREGARVEAIERGASPSPIRVRIAANGGSEMIEGSHLLIAAGRKPNIQDLNLDAAGIKHDKRGILVDHGLLTSNPKVFAIGDVAGGPQFTHVAGYHAGIVMRRALFRLPAKARDDIIPWVTYTEPELAHVGLTEDQAKTRHGAVNVYRWPFHENDRAQAERTTHGFVKVVTTKKGKILGASIVGPQAGELIQMWSLAVSQGMSITAMSQWISPYPTLSEVSKRAAGTYYEARAGSTGVRRLVNFLRRFG